MKSSEIKAGVEYGVVPSWRYANREARDPQQTSSNQVLKATIVSMDRYSYEVSRAANEDDPNFRRVTDPKDRRFGYKVTDGNMYWIARPQDIVEVWATLEARWAAAAAQQAILIEEQRKREEKSRELDREADAYAERLYTTLAPIIQNITGKRFSGSFSKTYYNETRQRVNPFVTVQMDARILERLVECVLEAQEA